MRLFVAVNPPSLLCRELTTRLDSIRGQVRLAWTAPTAWHLTLMFLDDWPPARIPALRDALQAAVAPHPPVVVVPGKVGAFPDLARPRVLFLHLDGGGALRQLARDVRDAVDRVWPDGPQDHKALHPHLTLARIKQPLAGPDLARLCALDLGAWEPFTVTEATLLTSELRREGARYAVAATLPLAG